VSVVDASVWVSRLVPHDVHHAASRHWLEQAVADGQPLVAPVFLLAEIAGAIARRTGDPHLAEQAIRQVLHVPGLRLVVLDRRLGLAAARAAGDLSLRGGDAVYVALAEQLGIPLVTWDADQAARAAARVTVQAPA
jgi:predicted nucleic acid-binding protein